jgi:cell division septation protein DedD
VHPSDKNAKGALSTPSVPSGAYVIQVAALLKQDDAVAIASSLQKKHYAVYVQKPQKDKYYRVQVGPFKDQKSADAAKKGLEGEGFKAFYVKH